MPLWGANPVSPEEAEGGDRPVRNSAEQESSDESEFEADSESGGDSEGWEARLERLAIQDGEECEVIWEVVGEPVGA